jgi:hypothetical protein
MAKTLITIRRPSHLVSSPQTSLVCSGKRITKRALRRILVKCCQMRTAADNDCQMLLRGGVVVVK